jgi:hypothetical protein
VSVTVPKIVDAYLAAKSAYDTDGVLATLADDAVITDEGNDYRGHETIRAWNERASKAVQATYKTVDAAVVAGRPVVAVEVAGNFPGSPVTLLFAFKLRDEKIAALTILG